jgi:hypothetical protein
VSDIHKHSVGLLIKFIKTVLSFFDMRLGAGALDATQQTRVILRY